MKKQLKTLVALSLIALLSLGLMGCGNTSQATSTAAAAGTAEAKPEAVTLKIGASSTPHGEILSAIKPLLAEKNINLDIVEFDDYVLPNTALENKELDANYFQHLPYLEDFNAKNGTNLSSAAAIHYEPMGIYAGQVKSLADLQDGATIAVPNDATNEARALLLLEQAGLIKVKEDAGLQATVLDIVENPKNIKIQELEAAQVSRALPDVAMGIINGNYAILAGLKASDALMSEDKDSVAAQTFGNIIAVRTGDENNENIKALVEALKSDTCKQFIEEKYQGAVVPLF